MDKSRSPFAPPFACPACGMSAAAYLIRLDFSALVARNGGMRAHGSRPGFGLFVAISLICLLAGHIAQAGSATWNLDRLDNDWNNPANWTPQTVPHGPTDVATFAESSKTDLKFSAAATEVAEMVFEPGASSFNITASGEIARTDVTLTISGAGITNNFGVTQNLTAGPTVVFDLGIINFRNSATAGVGTALN